MERKGLAHEVMAVSLAVISMAASVFMIMDRKENGPRFLPDYESFVPPEGLLEEEAAFIDENQDGIEDTQELDPEEQAALGLTGDYVSELPRTQAEVESAFRRSIRHTCLLVPMGNPVELSSFTPYIMGEMMKKDEVPEPSARRHALSLGLDIDWEDERNLPTLSSSMIVSYLRDNYISIQARVGKDSLTSEPFLYPCPIAATTKFRGAYLTEQMEAAARDAARNFRGLGVVMKPGQEATPENRRTMAMIQKYNLAEAGDTGRNATARYEFVFVRGRMDQGRFALHAFISDQDRTVLTYLGTTRKPSRTSSCDIQANVFFTEYSHAELVPETAVVRSFKVQGRNTYTMDQLNQFATAQQWEGDALSNLSETLDAIIDGKLN